jgi:hypothetical protein
VVEALEALEDLVGVVDLAAAVVVSVEEEVAVLVVVVLLGVGDDSFFTFI